MIKIKAISLIVLLVLVSAPVFAAESANATSSDCWMKYLEKFFILNATNNEKSAFQSANPEVLCAGSVPLSILQKAKANVDATPVSTSGNFTAYAYALREAIHSLNGQTVDVWIVDYPAQLPVVSQNGKPIPAGTSIVLVVSDTITISPKSSMDEPQTVNVVKVDNVNPPWMGIEATYGIECDGSFDAKTMEMVQSLCVARVTKIELLT